MNQLKKIIRFKVVADRVCTMILVYMCKEKQRKKRTSSIKQKIPSYFCLSDTIKKKYNYSHI